MTIYIAVFLGVLAYVIFTLPGVPRIQWAAVGIIAQTGLSYSIQLAFGSDALLMLGAAFTLIGCTYIFFAIWPLGSALGIISFIIGIMHILGDWGYLSTSTGQGMFAPTIWNFKTWLAYLQLFLLWEIGNGFRSNTWRGYY